MMPLPSFVVEQQVYRTNFGHTASISNTLRTHAAEKPPSILSIVPGSHVTCRCLRRLEAQLDHVRYLQCACIPEPNQRIQKFQENTFCAWCWLYKNRYA